MRTFRLTLEYDGTDFYGWQVQAPGQRTVQGELSAALARVTGEEVGVIGAGRTDAGVHAQAQVASVRLASALAPDTLRRALNAVLPGDVAVREVAEAAPDFHALRDARGKLYRYAIWNGRSRSPLRDRSHYYVAPLLDVKAMGEAAQALVGTHDFRSFQAAGSDVTTSVRRLWRCEVTAGEPGEILIWFGGQGFLRHMVRIAVGTLLEVGRGRRSPAGVSEALEACERSAAGPTAPARGLTLMRVEY